MLIPCIMGTHRHTDRHTPTQASRQSTGVARLDVDTRARADAMRRAGPKRSAHRSVLGIGFEHAILVVLVAANLHRRSASAVVN